MPAAPPPNDLPGLRDRIRPGVRVLFVGINPGVRSALTGHHFAGYSNRFWKLLSDSGLVARSLSSEQDDELPQWGFGLTNLVARPTPGIGDLGAADYVTGRAVLLRKIRRHRPAAVALVGVTLYRVLFGVKTAPVALGLQEETLGRAAVFVLPNPSGRNANYSYAEMLAAFEALRRWMTDRSPR
jgi:double-stranded uracil-DNA glycosylase